MLFGSIASKKKTMNNSNKDRIKEWVKCSSLPQNRPQPDREDGVEPNPASRSCEIEANRQTISAQQKNPGNQDVLKESIRTLQNHAESAFSLAAAVCAAVIPIQHLHCAGSRKPAEHSPTPSPEMLYAQYERNRLGREPATRAAPASEPAGEK